MKTFIKYSLAALSLLTIVTISGCDRRSCNDVICGVNQQCQQGNCYCQDGYEGTDCNTPSADKYVGNYSVYESCTSGPANFPSYNTSIYKDNFDERIIYISDLFGQGAQATAYIFTDQSNTGNYFEINSQSQGGIQFSGNGTYDVVLNRITLNLNYTWNFGSYSCTHTFIKQ